MQEPMSVSSLILNASIVVQFIMVLLLGLSVTSWGLIFSKSQSLRTAKQQCEKFEQAFWSGADMSQLYANAKKNPQAVGLEKIFHAGFAEYIKLCKNNSNLNNTMDGTRRAMRACAQRELDQLDHHTSFLATVGSVSPYIGLLGTVWGIMNAFIGLGNAGQASLNTVAPGIAEALIATAIGLFAAIPAVVAYNRFATDTDRMATLFDTFMEEFSNILQRSSTH